jgi:hypothetical protein
VAEWCSRIAEVWPWPSLSSYFTEVVTTITVRELSDTPRTSNYNGHGCRNLMKQYACLQELLYWKKIRYLYVLIDVTICSHKNLSPTLPSVSAHYSCTYVWHTLYSDQSCPTCISRKRNFILSPSVFVGTRFGTTFNRVPLFSGVQTYASS